MRAPVSLCLTACLSVLLAACDGGGGADDVADKSLSVVPTKQDEMANGCYMLRSVDTQALVARNGSVYTTRSGTPETFYVKPAQLGKEMFYGHDKLLMTVSGSAVSNADEPTAASVWDVTNGAGDGNSFLIKSDSAGKTLAVGSDGNLVLADAATARFEFVPASGCAEFPEMPVDVIGETYKGDVTKPVIGFAEVHTHMAMGHEMSGEGGVGPSAGGTLYGQMFNNLGVTEALKDCEPFHGPQGIVNADTVVHLSATSLANSNPLNLHDTKGWPTFVDWPSAQSLTHQGMYYKWVERAYKAGLRIMVSHGTNIDSLCQVGRAALSTVRPANLQSDCDDMSLAKKQINYLKELQDYVDAQSGGKDKGWFRIVGSPQQARQVIADGKLAVIPGVEVAHIFDCKVTVNPLTKKETSGCDKAHIDQQIDELYALGVRQLFPYHDIDSSLGGAGIFNGLFINMLNFYDTKQFWQTYDCPDGGEGDKYFYPAGSVMTTALPGTGNDPVTSLLIGGLQGTLPAYKPGVRQCNNRGMSDLGHYAVQELMKKKMVIDIDHAELSIKSDMIQMAKDQAHGTVPPYPLISAHGGHGGISKQQALDILNIGGLIYPYKPNGRGEVDFMNGLKPLWPASHGAFAVGYGSDTNGFGGLAGPRGAGSKPVQYPFTLFSGDDWGPQFAAAGIKPIIVGKLTIPESGKSWNVDEDGMAHYGMVADFVEETRLEGGKDAITTLYNSAEAYLKMWEQVVNR